jgi:hypothetical protein
VKSLRIEMKKHENQIQRASNIIWNASSDYSFEPDAEAYDESGKADLYLNYIIGAVHKYYDYEILQDFFSYLKEDIDHDFYEKLTWLGLENCTYEKGKDERPVIESLRIAYAKKIIKSNELNVNEDIFYEIELAHFQKVLGLNPKMSEPVSQILNDLEFDAGFSTEEIITKMDEIINLYFSFSPSQYEKNISKLIEKSKRIFRISEKRNRHNKKLPILKHYNIKSADFSGEINIKDKEYEQKNFNFHKFIKQKIINQREFIENYYGISSLTSSQNENIEKLLCIGNHKNLHLHFTCGNYDVLNANKEAVYHKNLVLKQREKNEAHYEENLGRNNSSIQKLTNKIKNALLLNQEYPISSKTGKLEAGKIWRYTNLDDKKVFMKSPKDDTGNLSVDIMLDSSGSQMNRQELVSEEGYIIAKSLENCRIPVRVFSFNSLRNYTIISLYRNYNETNKNENIFNYHATGCNRDGLAIRTALYMMKNTDYFHKILIVLSDGKPNDTQGIALKGFNHVQYDYSDAMGVDDTAAEVRKGRQNGISILCVFTGLDEDIPAAKKIYGRSMARIKASERFADIVGVMIQNELKSL